MPRAELDIFNGFYQSVAKTLLNKRLINLHITVPDGPAFNQKAALGTPGVKLFKATLLDGVSRGTIKANGVPYYVIGNNFISFTENGVVTNHGNISGSSPVSMAFNTRTIAIQDPTGDSYFFTVATLTLVLNNDPIFLGQGQARTVTFRDPYLVYNTDFIFFNSSAFTTNNGQDFDALDFGSADISPDLMVAVHTNHNQLYVAGEDSTQVFTTRVTSTFPFVIIPGAVIQVGCDARLSLKEFDNGFIMVGSEKDQLPAVWKIVGSSKQKLSTPGIEQVLHRHTETEISNAIVDTYAQDGGVFAVITIGDNTLVYDATASLRMQTPIWHERQTGTTDGLTFARWRMQHVIKIFGKIFSGDSLTSQISELDPDTFFELSDRIERVIQSQPFNVEGTPIFSHEQELFIESGVGNSDSPDPEWLFKYSDDLGRTWSNRIARPMGKVGEFTERLIWSRMGRIPYNRVVHFKTDDPVKIALLKLEAEAEAV